MMARWHIDGRLILLAGLTALATVAAFALRDPVAAVAASVGVVAASAALLMGGASAPARRRWLALGCVGVALSLAVCIARLPERVPLATAALLALLLLAALSLQATVATGTRKVLAVAALLAPGLLVAWLAGLGAAAATPQFTGVAVWWQSHSQSTTTDLGTATDTEPPPINVSPRHSDINLDPNEVAGRDAPVAYLRLPNRAPDAAPRQVYLRDQVFTTFDGRRWDSPRMPPQWLRDADDGTTDGVIRLKAGGGEAHQVYLTENAPPYLLAMPETRSVGLARLVHTGQAAYRLPTREGHRVAYMAVSAPVTWQDLPADIDIAAGLTDPSLLGIPDNPTGARFSRAARIISQTAPNTRVRIDLLLAYMKNNYTYSRASVEPSDDPVGDFFFDRRSGHCQFYASSFILLLRASGLPARLAVGYSGAAPDPETGIYVYTGHHRHAWPEVYLADYGWVIVDPTPVNTQDPELRQASAAALADFSPDDYTVLGDPLTDAGEIDLPTPHDGTGTIVATGLAAAVAAFLIALWSRRRRDAIATLVPSHVPREPAYLQALFRHFAPAHPRRPGTTLAEYLAQITFTGLLTEDLSDIRAYHYSVHYEGAPADPARERAFSRRIRALPPLPAPNAG